MTLMTHEMDMRVLTTVCFSACPGKQRGKTRGVKLLDFKGIGLGFSTGLPDGPGFSIVFELNTVIIKSFSLDFLCRHFNAGAHQIFMDVISCLPGLVWK